MPVATRTVPLREPTRNLPPPTAAACKYTDPSGDPWESQVDPSVLVAVAPPSATARNVPSPNVTDVQLSASIDEAAVQVIPSLLTQARFPTVETTTNTPLPKVMAYGLLKGRPE